MVRCLVLSWLILSSGCAAFLRAPNPMPAVTASLAEGDAKCLVVLLPGAGDRATDFEKNGFIAALRSRELSVDVVAADATIGYYAKGELVERLRSDVVLPAKKASHQQTWVVGMSMGGMGTLLYSRDFSDEVSGVLLLAPFLGNGVAEEVRDAGGLAKWAAPPKVERVTEGNYQREMWRWLQEITRTSQPKVYLGWGVDDGLGKQAQVLADALPAGHVFTVPGAHKWAPWRAIFEQFLDASDFARDCR